MSVTVLYCEGNAKSIDIRLIRQLLPKCDIRPLGGKTSTFMESIIADRQKNINLAGLVDRDFDCRNSEVINIPVNCIYEQTPVGWAWERKEIENYLLDPVVVQQALGGKAPPKEEYQAALDQAAERISAYSAARTALACYRFKNFWGEEVRKGHCFPDKVGKKVCREKIAEIVRENKRDRVVLPEDVVEKFDRLLPLFHPGGIRFQHYLHFFAGKDLLYAMRESLVRFGFESTAKPTPAPEEVFLERMINRIERAEEVWTWLPEWQELRQLIEVTDFSG